MGAAAVSRCSLGIALEVRQHSHMMWKEGGVVPVGGPEQDDAVQLESVIHAYTVSYTRRPGGEAQTTAPEQTVTIGSPVAQGGLGAVVFFHMHMLRCRAQARLGASGR